MFGAKDRVWARRRRGYVPPALILVLALLAPVTRGEDDTAAYLFGVFPYLPVVQIERLFGPLALEFSAALGRPVHLRSAASMAAFRHSVRAQRFDIAFFSPFLYIEAHDRHGYLPLARNSEVLRGVVAVLRDGPVDYLAALRGTVLALPPRQAAVSAMSLLLLRDLDLRPGTDLQLSYHKHHGACLHSVLIGRAAACVTAAVPLRVFDDGADRFRVVGHTLPMPASPLAAHVRLDGAQRALLRDRAVALASNAAGRRMLSDLSMRALVPAHDTDYDLVRAYAERLKQP